VSQRCTEVEGLLWVPRRPATVGPCFFGASSGSRSFSGQLWVPVVFRATVGPHFTRIWTQDNCRSRWWRGQRWVPASVRADQSSSESEEDHGSDDFEHADARKRKPGQKGHDPRQRKTDHTQTRVTVTWSVIIANVTQEEADHDLRTIAKVELDGAARKCQKGCS